MRRCRNWTIAVAVVAAWCMPARSAENDRLVPEEGAVQIMLLRQKAVRDDLKLNDEQARKIHDFAAQQWKKAQAINELPAPQRDQKYTELGQENEQFLSHMLDPARRKRLDEITLQTAGLLWVTTPTVATQIGLTNEQRSRAREMQQESRKEMQDLVHARDRAERHAKLKELRATSRKRLYDLLTDQQEIRWKQMMGAPFQGEIRFHPEFEGGQ